MIAPFNPVDLASETLSPQILLGSFGFFPSVPCTGQMSWAILDQYVEPHFPSNVLANSDPFIIILQQYPTIPTACQNQRQTDNLNTGDTLVFSPIQDIIGFWLQIRGGRMIHGESEVFIGPLLP